MRKRLVIFGGSNELSDVDEIILNKNLINFFDSIKNDISEIVYGGGGVGVMGIVLNAAVNNEINIRGYSLEKYKNYDEKTDLGIEYYKNDDERMEAFYEVGDIFLALPGGFGTLREILTINELIKRNGDLKNIFVPIIFNSFTKFIKELESKNMIAEEDKGIIKIIEDFDEIKI